MELSRALRIEAEAVRTQLAVAVFALLDTWAEAISTVEESVGLFGPDIDPGQPAPASDAPPESRSPEPLAAEARAAVPCGA